MTSTMTTKQAAASVRKTLGKLEGHGGTLTSPLGEPMFTLPAGLGFSIRATKSGVNIEIQDRGWVDRVTGGERETISERRAESEAVRAEVDKVRGYWNPPLPGKTAWGMIIISARATTTARDGTSIAEVDHYDPRLYCDRCRTEILRGEGKHEVAGRTPGRIDTLCDACDQAEWNLS